MILIKKTKSLSPLTYNEIDAEVVLIDNIVYMIKRDENGKEYKSVIDHDYDLYKELTSKKVDSNIEPSNIHINSSSKCNLNCNLCYAFGSKEVNEITPVEVEKILTAVEGKNIILSGREPTCNTHLKEIIKVVSKKNNAMLLTNGIKFSDFDYLNSLREQSPFNVIFSFNGFSNQVYEKINSEPLLDQKLKALENLKKLTIPTEMSLTIVPGINEDQIKPIFNFCMENLSWIVSLTIRSSSPVGKHIGQKQYSLSELLKLFSKNTGYEYETIKKSGEITRKFFSDMFRSSHYFPRPCCLAFHVSKKPPHILIESKNDFKNLIDDIIKGKNNSSVLPSEDKLNKKDSKTFEIAHAFFKTQISSWPNIYNIDLEEIKKCPSPCHSESSKHGIPFCYYNNKKC